MSEWPRTYHPASYVDGEYVVDETVTAHGYQIQPGTWAAVAAWCGGLRVLDEDGNQGVVVLHGFRAPATVARLGDFVMSVRGGFEVSPADGHYQRWADTAAP